MRTTEVRAVQRDLEVAQAELSTNPCVATQTKVAQVGAAYSAALFAVASRDAR